MSVGEIRIRIVAENFFTTAGGTAVHEIGFYGGCSVPDDVSDEAEFVGAEGPGSVFRWVSAGELAELDVRPRAVADLLFDVPEHPVHLQLGP